MLVETLSGLEAGSLRGVSQDAARASYAPVLSRADGAWSPAWTAAHLEGRVRGFDPWPGVVAARSGVRLRIVEARARAGDASDAPPGTVIDLAEGALRVACAAGTVASVAALQPAGRRALSAREALNGRHLAPGDRLEPPEPAS